MKFTIIENDYKNVGVLFWEPPEIWKDVEGYEGIYQISNKSRVRSFKNNKWGLSDNYKIISQTYSCGYKTVGLCIEGKVKRKSVHRLVAKAFIPNPEDKPNINHKDLDRANNDISNLEWCTQSENCKHAYDNGTHEIPGLKGENHANSKLTKNEVLMIRKRYKEGGCSQRYLAREYNVSQYAIFCMVNRKTWKHI